MGVRFLTAFCLMAFFTLSGAQGKRVSTKLFDFELLPTNPRSDEDFILYVVAKTDFTSEKELELLAQFTLNDVPVVAESLSPKLWALKFPAANNPGSFVLKARLSIQEKVKASELSKRIREINDEILQLKAAMVISGDPANREMINTSIISKKNLQADLKRELALLPHFIGEDAYKFTVDGIISGADLFKTIQKAETRHVMIQNNDSGWDYYVTNQNELRNRGNASAANQFGLHAQGLLDAHKVTKNAYYLRALENTAQTLFSLPVGVKVGAKAAKCTYLYATDATFLINAGHDLGFPELGDKGRLSASMFKQCLAAMHLLNTLDTNLAAIDTVSQGDIESVTNAQITQKYLTMLTAAGRPAGLRAFDFLLRFEEALAADDRGLAAEIAEVVFSSANGITPAGAYYLTGTGATLEILGEFSSVKPAYKALIETLKVTLLQHQKQDGLFEHVIGSTISGGGTQDNAFVLRGLLKIGGQDVVIDKAVRGFRNIQQAAGGFFIYNYEFIEGQAELMSAFSKIALAHGIPALEGESSLVEAEITSGVTPMRSYDDRQHPGMKDLPSKFIFTAIEQ